MKPTDEQTAILDAVKGSKHSLMIRARAGCGKTTMLELIDRAEKSAPYLLMCFNKAIATEAEKRMRSATTVRTFNSLGHKIWAAAVDRKLSLNYLRIPKSPPSSLVRTKVHDPYKQITELVPTKFALS